MLVPLGSLVIVNGRRPQDVSFVGRVVVHCVLEVGPDKNTIKKQKLKQLTPPSNSVAHLCLKTFLKIFLCVWIECPVMVDNQNKPPTHDLEVKNLCVYDTCIFFKIFDIWACH